MLVLSRRENESIYLPGLDVEFKVIGIRGGRVQIGIAAPREIEITRTLDGPPKSATVQPTETDAPTVVKPLTATAKTRLTPRRMISTEMVAVGNVCGK